jgi:glycerol-3-phosphate dehydrogenase
MHRNLSGIAAVHHDIVVVGGGVHGACAAWEATRAGLRVALIEAADFGHATTSNSLRTFHGGIRYLQQLDFRRMRESIRERREWLRLAPNLVEPMRFVLPTEGHGMRGREVMRAALAANDLVSIDRNRGLRPDLRLPRGEIWSEAQAREVFSGTTVGQINGAAAWHDAICLNTERLLISILSAAAAAGAWIANYARAIDLMRDCGELRGVVVHDELTGREHEIRASVVINAAGPWVDEWLPASGSAPKPSLFSASKAFNLITRPLPFADALGLSCPTADGTARNTYFLIPWNGRTLVGTRHVRCDPSTRHCAVTPADVQAFLNELNPVLGRHRLAASDIMGVYSGLLPEREDHVGNDVALLKTARVIDHGGKDGWPGLYSVVGIKWTTARAVAERAVRMASKHVHKRKIRAPQRKLIPADVPAVQDLIAKEPTLAERIAPDLPVTRAHVVHAVRDEMAFHLWDVIRRRTPLYLSRDLDDRAIRVCAQLMATELRWPGTETVRQIEDCNAELQAFRLLPERKARQPIPLRAKPTTFAPGPSSTSSWSRDAS